MALRLAVEGRHYLAMVYYKLIVCSPRRIVFCEWLHARRIRALRRSDVEAPITFTWPIFRQVGRRPASATACACDGRGCSEYSERLSADRQTRQTDRQAGVVQHVSDVFRREYSLIMILYFTVVNQSRQDVHHPVSSSFIVRILTGRRIEIASLVAKTGPNIVTSRTPASWRTLQDWSVGVVATFAGCKASAQQRICHSVPLYLNHSLSLSLTLSLYLCARVLYPVDRDPYHTVHAG